MPTPDGDGELLLIHEIFHSIQGESTWAGVPMTFLRLSGCPLRCTYCDTEYAFEGGQKMTLAQIEERVEALGCSCVEVTGGEPLAQKACPALLRRLCELGKTVLLETAGSHDLSGVEGRVHIIMDLKAPGSGELRRNRWENLAHLRPERDEVKLVLKDRADYEWALGEIRGRELPRLVKAVLLSPVFGVLPYRTLAEWLLADRLPNNVRMQLQLHKHIWAPETRGV